MTMQINVEQSMGKGDNVKQLGRGNNRNVSVYYTR